VRKNGNGQVNRRAHEEGMVRLLLSAGKAQGTRPNDVVGTIAFHADIPGRTIGAIRIQEQHTLVDVPEKFVTKVLDKSGSYQIHRQPVTIERA
jgi:ATP-dependent RNA helicase DeaD